MALQTNQTESYLPSASQPQQNQFLTGNLDVQGENAQTDWMKPESSFWNPSGRGPIEGQTSQPTTPPQSGTAMGAISAGNVGQWMPQGYDQGKWDNPNKHDPKYDVGRILSKYPPGPAGLQAAAPELEKLGFKIYGKDKIVGPDGYPVDVGQGFSGGMENGSPMNWWWNPSNPGNNQPGNSAFGQSQGNGFMQFLQQLFGGQQQGPAYSGTFNRRTPYDPTMRGPQQNPQGGDLQNPERNILEPYIPSYGPSTNPWNAKPTPDVNGYYGGWQDETGLRHAGNQPGMSYLL